MHEVSPTAQSPTESSISALEKPKRNWKKILLLLLTALFVVTLVGVGLYLLIPELTQEPPSKTQKQATPSAESNKPAEYVLLVSIEEKLSAGNYTNGIYLLDPENPPPKKILDNPDYHIFEGEAGGAGDLFSGLSVSKDGKYLRWSKISRIKSSSTQYYARLDGPTIKNVKSIEIKPSVASGYVTNFRWSPDNLKIAVIERVGDGPDYFYKARILEVETKKQLYEFDLSPPAKYKGFGLRWDVEDKLTVFESLYDTTGKQIAEEKTVVYSLDGKKESEGVIYSIHYRSRPGVTVSDDGKNIAVVRKFEEDSKFRSELWYGNIDGSGIRKLADLYNGLDCLNETSGSISPNKKLIIVGSGCADNLEGKIVDIKSGKIVTTKISTSSGIWSPDGKQIWVKETLFENYQGSPNSKTPVSESNYIISKEGKVIKKFDALALHGLVWVSR